MINIKIDIVIPLYNKKSTIERCVLSCLNQYKLSFNKIYIINDGSNDGVEPILDILKKKNEDKIEIISQENCGVSVARNYGIKKSSADFITFLDADDELNEYYLYEICRILKKYKDKTPRIISCKHQNIYQNDTKKIKYVNLKSSLNYTIYPLLHYTFNKNIVCSSGITIQRELILKNLFPKNIKIGEDLYIWEKLFLTEKLFFSNQTLIYIFKNSENRSKSNIEYDPPYNLINYRNILQLKNYNFLNLIFFYLFHFTSLIIEYIKLKSFGTKSATEIYKSQNFFNKIFLKLIDFIFTKKNIRKIVDTKGYLDFDLYKSFSYLLISPTAPLIFLSMYFQNLFELANKYLIYSSAILIILQILSFQNRTYLFSNISRFKYSNYIFLRFLITINVIVFFYIFLNIFEKFNEPELVLTFNFIIAFWILELLFLFYEKFYSDLGFKNLLRFVIFVYILMFILGFKVHNYLYISYITLIVVCLITLYNIIKISAFKYFKIMKVINNYTFNYFILSAILFVFSNFFIRFLLSKNFDGYELSTIFLILSFFTFPSTFYIQSFSQYITDIFQINRIYKFFLIIILIFSFILLILINNGNSHLINLNILCILFSIGSCLLLLGQMYRSLLIRNNKFKNLLKYECIHFLSILFFVYLLYFEKQLIYFYLLFSGTLFYLFFKKNINYENFK